MLGITGLSLIGRVMRELRVRRQPVVNADETLDILQRDSTGYNSALDGFRKIVLSVSRVTPAASMNEPMGISISMETQWQIPHGIIHHPIARFLVRAVLEAPHAQLLAAVLAVLVGRVSESQGLILSKLRHLGKFGARQLEL